MSDNEPEHNWPLSPFHVSGFFPIIFPLLNKRAIYGSDSANAPSSSKRKALVHLTDYNGPEVSAVSLCPKTCRLASFPCTLPEWWSVSMTITLGIKMCGWNTNLWQKYAAISVSLGHVASHSLLPLECQKAVCHQSGSTFL